MRHPFLPIAVALIFSSFGPASGAESPKSDSRNAGEAQSKQEGPSRDPVVRRIRSYDRDGDGKVSRPEASPTLRERYFGRIDTNKDDFIDRDELARFEQQRAAARDGRGGSERSGRGRPAITDAPVVAADEAGELVTEKELVIGVVLDGKARAYPVNMLCGPSREIINDELGGRSIAATW